MSDEADMANEQMEKWLSQQMKVHQHRSSQVVNAYPVGECRNCQTRLDDGRAFCDAHCRTDFESRLAASRRNGKYRGG